MRVRGGGGDGRRHGGKGWVGGGGIGSWLCGFIGLNFELRNGFFRFFRIWRSRSVDADGNRILKANKEKHGSTRDKHTKKMKNRKKITKKCNSKNSLLPLLFFLSLLLLLLLLLLLFIPFVISSVCVSVCEPPSPSPLPNNKTPPLAPPPLPHSLPLTPVASFVKQQPLGSLL